MSPPLPDRCRAPTADRDERAAVKASAFFAQPFERSLPKFLARSQPSMRDLGAKF